MRIVAISDTHGLYTHMKHPIPEGDVLVHAGDITLHGELAEVSLFSEWLAQLPHKHKVIIAGNHDWVFQRRALFARDVLKGCTYLCDESTTIDGVVFYGSPWQPTFYNWAFNLDRGAPIKAKWDLIPDNTDVLITHGPPFEQLDIVPGGARVGCEDLTEAIARVRPKAHIFGHIHHSYGIKESGGVIYVNASICNEAYQPVNAPLVFDL